MATIPTGPLAGVTIAAFPHYPRNPWQQMLYRRSVDEGAHVAPCATLEDLLAALASVNQPKRTILHVNWTAAVSQLGGDVLEAMARARAFIGAVEELLARGGHVVWTIHNVLPHELRFRLPELFILRRLAEKASAIVVMNPHTVEAVRDLYPLASDKVVVIPHPSYLGEYPDDVTRAEARKSFGLAESDIVAVALGVIRPYKNVELLAGAYADARVTEPRLKLLVGGEIGPGTNAERLEGALRAAGAIYRTDFIANTDVQRWFRAADFAVFPFEGVLNTGSVLLSSSFGVPAVLTDLPATKDLAAEDWVATVPRELSRAGLAEALVRAAREFPGEAKRQKAALDYAADRSPDRVSGQFAALLEGMVSAGSDTFGA